MWPVPILLEVPKVNPASEPEAEGRTPVLAPAVGVAVVAFDIGYGGVLGAANDGLFNCVPENDDGNVLVIPADAPVGPTADVWFVRG